MEKNYYELLGVTRQSTDDEIKKAYRKLAMQYHPDRNPDNKDAAAKFGDIAQAYETLSDLDKKKKYDITLDSPFNRSSAFNPYGSYPGSDIWQDIFSNKANSLKKGQNIIVNLPLSLKEIYTGTKKVLRVKKYKKCKSCSGNGSLDGRSFQKCYNCKGTGFTKETKFQQFAQVITSNTCTQCYGTGKMILEVCEECLGKGASIIEEDIEIEIPKGTLPGMQLNLQGKGNEEPGATMPGDLILNIKEILSENYERIGTNIKTIKEITFIDACLGTELSVTLPLGDIVSIVVEPGTTHGTILQLKGKGLYEFTMGSNGDFQVEIHIKIPKYITPEEKRFLLKLSRKELFL